MKDLLLTNGKWNPAILKKERWLYYLCITEHNAANVERIDSIQSITGRETLDYVFRTLDILEHNRKHLSPANYERLKKVLQWSEVAKGGSKVRRERWVKQGLPIAIHNLASAEIYLEESTDLESEKNIIYPLIKTHGILGQNLRGEVSVAKNEPLLALKDRLSPTDFYELLYYLNQCVIGAVDMSLWNSVSEQVTKLIQQILDGNLTELEDALRAHSLCRSFADISTEDIQFLADEIFPRYELWYFDAALSDFSAEQIKIILRKLLHRADAGEATHITFKPLADSLYYDYEGKKHINIYKKRVIEKYLRDDSIENVRLHTESHNQTLSMDFCFSPACEKLIDFCVEAERSGLLTYEKSITILFDMFGFRKDEFDRLNNEDKYLKTMNDSADSTKSSIADYVTGHTLVDVGSGGGIMLDLLEEKYKDLHIIGTDISTNVIETLEKKKREEHHRWDVRKHNFVDGPFTEQNADTVIFSSILHEIYSYTDTDLGKFNLASVKTALKNAYASIPSGGRIVIRDGVKTPGDDLLSVHFLSEEGFAFFLNYQKDFKGLPDITENRPHSIDRKNLTVTGDVNFMREFLYTYTWGNESYSHEVQEQFGYFTLEEFVAFFRSLGARIVEARQFLEPGYEEHLGKLVRLSNASGAPAAFPYSNCIVVAEKN